MPWPRLSLEYIRALLRAMSWRTRRTRLGVPPSYSLAAPTFDTPSLKLGSTHVHQLKARELDLVLSFPGDSAGEQRARRFLYRLMVKHPSGLPRKIKADFRNVCQRRFNISKNAFDGIWTYAIAKSGSVAYDKHGPRGPHTGK